MENVTPKKGPTHRVSLSWMVFRTVLKLEHLKTHRCLELLHVLTKVTRACRHEPLSRGQEICFPGWFSLLDPSESSGKRSLNQGNTSIRLACLMVGNFVLHFHDWQSMWEGLHTPGRGVPGCIRKQAEQPGAKLVIKHPSIASASALPLSPCLCFLGMEGS